jgi:hypothetical protein
MANSKIIIIRNKNQWKAVQHRTALRLRHHGWTPVGVSNNMRDAQQMIVGLRSDELVESLLYNLPAEHKVIVKTEIASIATDFYNGMGGN